MRQQYPCDGSKIFNNCVLTVKANEVNCVYIYMRLKNVNFSGNNAHYHYFSTCCTVYATRHKSDFNAEANIIVIILQFTEV